MEVNKVLKQFLIREPFYGFLMLNLNKEIVGPEHDVKTAAVGPKGLGFTLYINEEFWNTLSLEQAIGLLKHEMMHLAFFHLSSNFKVPDNDFELMNISQDCEINQLINTLPPGGVTLSKLEAIVGHSLKPRKGSWYYFKELKNKQQENSKKLKEVIDKMIENGELTDHSLWPKDMSETETILIENHLKQIVKNTVEQVQAGSIPGELHDLISKLLVKNEVYNWRRHFRRLLGNSIMSYIDQTRYRPSKRFPDSPGLKTKYKPKVFVAVDTSGSIKSDDLKDFFSEIYHLYRSGVQVDVVEFDTKIYDIWPYKGVLTDIPIHGRGGTDCKEVITYYKQHKEYSSCIIFTDGYLNTNVEPCQQLIWVITKGGKHAEYPGKTIYIP